GIAAPRFSGVLDASYQVLVSPRPPGFYDTPGVTKNPDWDLAEWARSTCSLGGFVGSPPPGKTSIFAMVTASSVENPLAFPLWPFAGIAKTAAYLRLVLNVFETPGFGLPSVVRVPGPPTNIWDMWSVVFQGRFNERHNYSAFFPPFPASQTASYTVD